MRIKPDIHALFAVLAFAALAAFPALRPNIAKAEDYPPFEYNPGFLLGQDSNADHNNAVMDDAADDSDMIRELISTQLGAIHDRDAETAFSTLGDSLHGKFDSAKKFLARMRFEYSPIYNHDSYSFLESHSLKNGDIIQKVKVRDRYSDGSSLVIYHIKMDVEGHWVIDSFTVIEDESTPI